MTVIEGDLRAIKNVKATLLPNSNKGESYFGTRLGTFIFVPHGRTLRLTATLAVEPNPDIQNCHVLLREWVQAGEFKYQVQTPVELDGKSQEHTSYLTVREDGRVVEPFLMFRQSSGDKARPRETQFTVASMSHDLV